MKKSALVWIGLLLLLQTTGLAQYLDDGNLKNLGPEINTKYDESAPVISPDGSRLFFWSTGRPDGYGFQDVYVSTYDTVEKRWNKARNPGPPLNDGGSNIVLSITPDGQRLLMYKEASTPGASDLAIYKRSFDSWLYHGQIMIDDYENPSSSSITAYLAADGKTLIISNVEKETVGKEDLYVSFYKPDKRRWTKPKNLGTIINSPEEEITPFLSSDGQTLYFSSNRKGGFGGHDVYMSQRLDSTWLNWTKPKNLGARINTSGDDFHFKFPASAKFAVMVSTHADTAFGVADTSYGKRDIYAIKLPNDVRPQPVALVKGKVIDASTKKPLEAHIIYMTLPEGTHAGSAMSDPQTGEYKLILPSGKEYVVVAEGKGYVAMSENINITGEKTYMEINRDLLLVPLEVNQIFTLNNLFFEPQKTTLDPKSQPELMRLILLMQTHPELLIEIGGHTDPLEDKQLSKDFSEKRAKAVAEFLYKHHIEQDRIFIVGYGHDKPIAPNDTEEGRHKNRRVEIKIIGL